MSARRLPLALCLCLVCGRSVLLPVCSFFASSRRQLVALVAHRRVVRSAAARDAQRLRRRGARVCHCVWQSGTKEQGAGQSAASHAAEQRGRTADADWRRGRAATEWSARAHAGSITSTPRAAHRMFRHSTFLHRELSPSNLLDRQNGCIGRRAAAHTIRASASSLCSVIDLCWTSPTHPPPHRPTVPLLLCCSTDESESLLLTHRDCSHAGRDKQHPAQGSGQSCVSSSVVIAAPPQRPGRQR